MSVKRNNQSPKKNTEQEESKCSVFVKKAMTGLVKAVKQSTALPVLGTPSFVYYNDFPQYKALLEGEASKILALMQNLIDQQSAVGNILDTNEESSVDHKFTSLIDINDRLLESINKSLDIIENPKTVEESPLLFLAGTEGKPVKYRRSHPLSWNANNQQPSQRVSSTADSLMLNNSNDTNLNESDSQPSSSNKTPKSSVIKILSSAVIARPQVEFKNPPDNLNAPFIPPIKLKPNSLQSLEKAFEMNTLNEEGQVINYAHPYQYELESFDASEFLTAPSVCQQAAPLNASSDVVIITTTVQLYDLVKKLKSVSEIAVDLEHHSYRSYLGLTCLMQLSTRDQDYIIDTLALRDDVHLFNKIFTDPKIVKVFHGADSDLMWLQRDFGVYVVNLFDTGIAARALSKPRLSLSYLLQTYCGFSPNKEFQLADWRIRPLPQELIDYARSDTHYLLSVYDELRKELATNNLLAVVWDRSRDLCLRRYEKPQFTDSDYLDFYRQTRKRFNNRQLFALEKLFVWRDSIARLEDESTHYVLPNHMLSVIADVLPREHTGVFACCNPVPPLIRKYVHDVHKIIMNARNLPLQEADLSWKASVTRTGMEDFGQPSGASRLDMTDRDDFYCHIPTHSTDPAEERAQIAKLKESIADRLKASPSVDMFCNSSKRLFSGINPIISRVCQLLAATMEYNFDVEATKPKEPVEEEEEEEPAEMADLQSVSLLDSLTRITESVATQNELLNEETVIIHKESNNKRKRQSKEKAQHDSNSKEGKYSHQESGPTSSSNQTAQFRAFDYQTESQRIFSSAKPSHHQKNYDPFSGYFDKQRNNPKQRGRGGHHRIRGGHSSGRPMETGNSNGDQSHFRQGRGHAKHNKRHNKH